MAPHVGCHVAAQKKRLERVAIGGQLMQERALLF